MVDIEDIPDFPGQPGQRPTPGVPTDVVPVDVVLVAAPLDAEYRNVALNAAAVDAYIADEVASGRAYSFTVERWSPWSPLQIEKPIEVAAQYNYGRFTIGERHWYGFLSAEYLNLTDTRFNVRGDEWTTYGPSLGYSMIERGHIAVAASQGDVYGSEYLTAPEPIEAPPVRGILTAPILGSGASGWTVLVISANDLRGSGGLRFFELHTLATEIMGAAGLASSATVSFGGGAQFDIPDASYPWTEGGSGGPDPEVTVPFVTPSPVSTIDGVAAGGGVYLFTPSGFAEYMTIMQGAPWVTSGIIDVRLVPTWAIGAGGNSSFTPAAPSTDPASGVWAAAGNIPVFHGTIVSATINESVLANWRTTVLSDLGAGIFRKLITAPFTDILLGNGSDVMSFHPDQWQTSALGFIGVTGAAHGDPSIRLIPTGYNDLGSQLGMDTPVGGNGGLTQSGYGMAASNVASQDLSPYLAAFSSHQTWIVAQKNRNLAITLGLTNIQLNAGVQGIQTVLGAAAGAAGGLIGGAGGAAGAGAAGFGAVAGSVGALATAGLTASNAITMLDVSEDGSFDITAYQLGLSGIASVNSFDTWFQSLSATSGSGRAEHLASAWRSIISQGFQAIISVPSAERVSKLLSEWTRYGYMIGQAFVPSRLDVMNHYSYWQTVEPTILGRLPQDARDSISAAFERGLTVWTAVSEIGTEPINTPRAGITY